MRPKGILRIRERWGRERDRKCGLVGKDNVPLDELSSSEGCLAEWMSGKTAEIIAAKRDPKRIFGRHLFSPLPDADAVDLCAAQIHSANSCENFLGVNRVFQIDNEVAEQSALVTSTGLSSGHFDGSGILVILAGTTNLADRCHPA